MPQIRNPSFRVVLVGHSRRKHRGRLPVASLRRAGDLCIDGAHQIGRGFFDARIGHDVRRLWDHPKSPPEFKKRVLRTVLKEIIASSDGDTVRLVLHWQGGDHTELTLQKTRRGCHRYITDGSGISHCAIMRFRSSVRFRLAQSRPRMSSNCCGRFGKQSRPPR
jgi:hypothetical protein